ncbi:MAG: hypothetical protein AAB493_01495 [Patescibacteria group bacterium]
MELSIERMATIIACMYGINAEIVVNFGIDECYLFYGIENRPLPIFYEEVQYLVFNDIIELDYGCDEPEHETEVYRLTENSLHNIQEIIKKKRKIKLFLE